MYADIAEHLTKASPLSRLADLEVTFHKGDKEWSFPLLSALDALVNNRTSDERGNWSKANRATLRGTCKECGWPVGLHDGQIDSVFVDGVGDVPHEQMINPAQNK